LKKNSNKTSNKTYCFLTDSNIQDLKPSYQQQEQQPKRSGEKEKKCKASNAHSPETEKKQAKLRKYQNAISPSLTPLS
jgi:hypothetical protein